MEKPTNDLPDEPITIYLKGVFNGYLLGIKPIFEFDTEKQLYYFELKGYRIYGWTDVDNHTKSSTLTTPYQTMFKDELQEDYQSIWRKKYAFQLLYPDKIFPNKDLWVITETDLKTLFDNLVLYDESFGEMILSLVDDLNLKIRIPSLKLLFIKVLFAENALVQNLPYFESETERTHFKDTLRYFKFGIQYRIKSAMEQNGYIRSDITGLKAIDFPIFDLSPDQAKEYETRKAQLQMPTNPTQSKIRIISKVEKDSDVTKADLHRVIIALHELNFFTDEHGGKISLTKVEKAFNDLLGCNFSDGDRANIRNAKEKATNEEIFDNLKGALNQYITRKNNDNKKNKKN